MSDYTFWRPHSHKAASSTSLSLSWIPVAWYLMMWRINQLLPILYPSQSTPELSKVEGVGGRTLLSYGHGYANLEFQRVFQLSWECKCSLILSIFIKKQSQGSFSHNTSIPSPFFLSQMLCVARVDHVPYCCAQGDVIKFQVWESHFLGRHKDSHHLWINRVWKLANSSL